MSCRFQSLKNFCRIGLAAMVAVCAFSGLTNESTAATDILTIGSEAPSLDVEHWVSDRDGDFKHITEFENDKVYVVEFWATWCGPCISSMPHLVELQGKYAEKGVQIISVSKEDLKTVEKFLKRNVRGDKEKTYAELTSAYCLTTDPDGSVSKDYMRAAGQGGIPTAFIVGKTGQIEWIGHPMKMDKPLEEIVEGKWDREKFAASFVKEQKADLAMGSIMSLMKSGKAEKALSKLDAFLAGDTEGVPKRTLSRMGSMRDSIAMEVGGEVAVAAFKSMVKSAGDNTRSIGRLTSRVVKMKKAGEELDASIVQMACEAAGKAVEIAEKDGKDKATAAAMHTHANLLYLCDKLEDAITVQKKAVALSEEGRIVEFLEKLEKELEEAKG